jgi:hypothetical protein
MQCPFCRCTITVPFNLQAPAEHNLQRCLPYILLPQLA